MDKPTIEELMDDIIALVIYPERDQDEFTADELLGRSNSTASKDVFRNMLDRKVDIGQLSKRYAMVDGKKRIVYKMLK